MVWIFPVVNSLFFALNFQLWKTYIKRPMILVGPSLGATVAVDFTATYPEAVNFQFTIIKLFWIKPILIYTSLTKFDYFRGFQVDKLVLINANAYSEGTGRLKELPKSIAYAGVCP